MTSLVKISKLHLSTRSEFGNNDFQNQRTQASKNTCVAKHQTKMPVGVTFWFPVSNSYFISGTYRGNM